MSVSFDGTQQLSTCGSLQDVLGQHDLAAAVHVLHNLLLQLVLHKHLTDERLGRIYRLQSQEIAAWLDALRRTGLVIESARGFCEISPYASPFVVRHLKNQGIL